MNNSNYRNADCSKQKNVKNANVVLKEPSEPPKQAKIKISSDSKVPIDCDKMAKIFSLLSVIIASVEKFEGDFDSGNSNSITLKILEDLLLKLT